MIVKIIYIGVILLLMAHIMVLSYRLKKAAVLMEITIDSCGRSISPKPPTSL